MNWKSILATALITGLVTLATGMVLFWWQSEKPQLTYNSIQSIPFDDTSNKLFIQQLEIKNSGDKAIEDVIFVLSFSNQEIQKSKIFIDKAISHTQKSGSKSIELKIDSLNPNEGASISVLFQSSSVDAQGGSVSLRGNGVTGKLIGAKKKDDKSILYSSLIAAYAGLIAFVISTRRGRKNLLLLVKGRVPDKETQRNEIASLLAMHGYPDKAREYLFSTSLRRYWVEADLLASEAINGNEKIKQDMIEVLKGISDIETIADGSKAIVFYNIARILKSSNSNKNNVAITKYIELAKTLDSVEIDRRMLVDPIFQFRT